MDKAMYDNMNSWFGKSGKFVGNVPTVDSLLKTDEDVLGPLGGMDAEGPGDEIDVGETPKDKEKNRKRKAHNEGSSGRLKKVDREVEETLYQLKVRDQLLNDNLASQTNFRQTMMETEEKRYQEEAHARQSMLQLEQQRLQLDQERNNRHGVQLDSILAVVTNLAQSLATIANSMKEKPKND
jgi:hypothetical protein